MQLCACAWLEEQQWNNNKRLCLFSFIVRARSDSASGDTDCKNKYKIVENEK